MDKVKWTATLLLLFGITLLSTYGSFVVNSWAEKGRLYLFVRQPQSELPVSSRQAELCPCECKLDQNISVPSRGDLNATSGENPFPHVDNLKKHVTLQDEIVSDVQAEDKSFFKESDETKLTHGVNLNVTPKKASQEKKKLPNSSRETRAPQSSNLRNLPTTLYKLAPNIFDTVPKEFSQQFKNPCWYGKRRKLLCLPYFYILGFPKCGTTDIWDKIHHHPGVEKTLEKELHFWRDRRIGSDERGFRKYLSMSGKHKHRLLSGDSQAVYCDGSATTIISNYRYVPYSTNVTNDMYTNADIIHEITPNAKIIIAIREPVERLYSGYLYHPTKKFRSAVDFHKEATKYVEDFQKCLQRSSKLRCVFEKIEEDGDSQRLKVGMYAPLIKHWVTRFGSNQTMVIRLEDWKKNCTSILPEIFNFLELKTLSEGSIQNICEKSSKNVNRGGHENVGEMWTSTKQLLQDFYAPFNEELSEYLNFSLYQARI